MANINMAFIYVPPADGLDPDDMAQEILEFTKRFKGLTLSGFGVDKQPESRDDAHRITRVVMDLWNSGLPAREKLRVTPARLSKVSARLANGFKEAEILAVVTKLKESPWHNGGNDRGWYVPGPEWVLHTTEKVEQWLRKGEQKIQTYADEVGRLLNNGILEPRKKDQGTGD